MTTQFLEWICTRLQAQGKTGFLLIWDHASWHYSKTVKTWISEHHRQVKQASKGVRILPFFLPTKSRLYQPDRAESWVHAKKALVEPNGLLTAKQLAEKKAQSTGTADKPLRGLISICAAGGQGVAAILEA